MSSSGSSSQPTNRAPPEAEPGGQSRAERAREHLAKVRERLAVQKARAAAASAAAAARAKAPVSASVTALLQRSGSNASRASSDTASLTPPVTPSAAKGHGSSAGAGYPSVAALRPAPGALSEALRSPRGRSAAINVPTSPARVLHSPRHHPGEHSYLQAVGVAAHRGLTLPVKQPQLQTLPVEQMPAAKRAAIVNVNTHAVAGQTATNAAATDPAGTDKNVAGHPGRGKVTAVLPAQLGATVGNTAAAFAAEDTQLGERPAQTANAKQPHVRAQALPKTLDSSNSQEMRPEAHSNGHSSAAAAATDAVGAPSDKASMSAGHTSSVASSSADGPIPSISEEAGCAIASVDQGAAGMGFGEAKQEHSVESATAAVVLDPEVSSLNEVAAKHTAQPSAETPADMAGNATSLLGRSEQLPAVSCARPEGQLSKHVLSNSEALFLQQLSSEEEAFWMGQPSNTALLDPQAQPLASSSQHKADNSERTQAPMPSGWPATVDHGQDYPSTPAAGSSSTMSAAPFRASGPGESVTERTAAAVQQPEVSAKAFEQSTHGPCDPASDASNGSTRPSDAAHGQLIPVPEAKLQGEQPKELTAQTSTDPPMNVGAPTEASFPSSSIPIGPAANPEDDDASFFDHLGEEGNCLVLPHPCCHFCSSLDGGDPLRNSGMIAGEFIAVHNL